MVETSYISFKYYQGTALYVFEPRKYKVLHVHTAIEPQYNTPSF